MRIRGVFVSCFSMLRQILSSKQASKDKRITIINPSHSAVLKRRVTNLNAIYIIAQETTLTLTKKSNEYALKSANQEQSETPKMGLEQAHNKES